LKTKKRRRLENLVKIEMDHDFLQNKIIQDIILNPDNDELGVVIFSQGYSPDSNNIMVSIYQVIKTNIRCYTPYYKLEEFKFSNFELADKFITQLPTMSALEMVVMLRSPDNVNPYISK
jgi:hypothetical protein